MLEFCNEQELINLERGQDVKIHIEYLKTSMTKNIKAVVKDNDDGEELILKDKEGKIYRFEYVLILNERRENYCFFKLESNHLVKNLKFRISKVVKPPMNRYRFMNK